ncbi:hypothetical protein ACFOY2_04305 [Nonomuraea purpurea]|uniref:Uncharacterized protein n=1 Tax=Nonomuraea purpurea TaxID=1849276 RepID=A0ABV8FZP2_9ACTN
MGLAGASAGAGLGGQTGTPGGVRSAAGEEFLAGRSPPESGSSARPPWGHGAGEDRFDQASGDGAGGCAHAGTGSGTGGCSVWEAAPLGGGTSGHDGPVAFCEVSGQDVGTSREVSGHDLGTSPTSGRVPCVSRESGQEVGTSVPRASRDSGQEVGTSLPGASGHEGEVVLLGGGTSGHEEFDPGAEPAASSRAERRGGGSGQESSLRGGSGQEGSWAGAEDSGHDVGTSEERCGASGQDDGR